MPQRFVPWTAICLVSLMLGGCGAKGVQGIPVTGTVTLDGKPLESGTIRFDIKDSGAKLSTSAPISHGKYEVPASAALLAGTYRVAVSGGQPTVSQPVMGPSTPPPDPVPARYNRDSELSATVGQTGPQVFDFQLKSQP